MAAKTLTIGDRLISARESDNVLEAARDANIYIPSFWGGEMNVPPHIT
ncbi:MAG: hypothetical protein AAGE96_02165 [Cyanobacteria bacterium P01_G01_bin.19]